MNRDINERVPTRNTTYARITVQICNSTGIVKPLRCSFRQAINAPAVPSSVVSDLICVPSGWSMSGNNPPITDKNAIIVA